MQIVTVLVIGIVIQRVLITQAHTCLTPSLEIGTILNKSGYIVLSNVGIGVGNRGLVNPIGIVAPCKGHLGPSLQHSFPHRI